MKHFAVHTVERGGWFGQDESSLGHSWRQFPTTTTEASSSRGGSRRRFNEAVDYPALCSTRWWAAEGRRIQITFLCMRAAQNSHPLKAWPHQLSSRQNIPETYFCAAAAAGGDAYWYSGLDTKDLSIIAWANWATHIGALQSLNCTLKWHRYKNLPKKTTNDSMFRTIFWF